MSSNKNLFISYVKDVIELDDGHYFKSLKEIYEGTKNINGTVSSNFFSGSSVQDSGRTSGVKYPYPAKTGQSLIYAEDKKIFVSDEYYPNLGMYLNATEKVALTIWLLRKVDRFDSFSLEEFRNILSDSYTQNLVGTLLNCSQEEWTAIKDSMMIDSSDEIAVIMMEDIIGEKNNYAVIIPTSLQQIYYGAPGTGKSHEINRQTEGKEVIRTTFHPDSDYSTFVGCYKPHMEEVDMTTVIGKELIVVKDENGQPKKERRIVYKYCCQAFLQTYIAAWQHPNKAQYLVIEEINRGNCAQIFGDIFQLLDRNDEGYSSYPVKTDADAEDELRALFAKEWNLTEEKAKEIDDLYRRHYPDGITKSIKDGSILLLPSNLYIWATMNTSDQSLFPIDSAFKRRWDWKYVKIAEGRDSETKELLNWGVKFDYEDENKLYTFECSWWEFIKAINEKIAAATSSDDKKLGYFFCKPKTQGSKEIDAERFVGKVVFYLWNDVFKDEDNAIFKGVEGNGDPSFDAFYTEDDKGKTIADTKALRAFMHNVFGEQSNLFTETSKETTDIAETVTE